MIQPVVPLGPVRVRLLAGVDLWTDSPATLIAAAPILYLAAIVVRLLIFGH